jgi:hypothetical protein
MEGKQFNNFILYYRWLSILVFIIHNRDTFSYLCAIQFSKCAFFDRSDWGVDEPIKSKIRFWCVKLKLHSFDLFCWVKECFMYFGLSFCVHVLACHLT